MVFASSALLAQNYQVSLPSSKVLSVPSPGRINSINGFPVTIAVSPDREYAAILNDGYGAEANQSHQSIAVINLKTHELADFPEKRLPEEAHQSYFIGLAFSSNGQHLYASIGSITDPVGDKPGDTGNGIAVYEFHQGKIFAERFIKIAPQKLLPGKKVAYGVRKTEPGTALPYPAGLAVIAGPNGDELLVADNLSDNVVLLDARDGRVLKEFDLSTHDLVPVSFPYTVVASHDGKRAWCSLWNLSRVAELDLVSGKVTRWIPVLESKDSTAPGSHPTAMLLSDDGNILYVTLSNVDKVAAVSTATGKIVSLMDTTTPGQKFSGSYPIALAESAGGKRLFVADAGTNAVAVFDTSRISVPTTSAEEQPPLLHAQGFIPTDWYPSALADVGDDLLIATAKGQGTGPNSGDAAVSPGSHRHRKHPYVASLLYGSISIINFPNLEKDLPELTSKVESSNLFNADPGHLQFASGTNPIHHVIYIIKENRTYDQILGDLKVGNGDSSLTLYGNDITPNLHKLALQFGVLDNFYDSGEVSGDGHDWSTAATTTDYNEQTWQIGYRGRERTYDYQGTVADESPLDEHVPDVDAPATGYIWDNVASHGLTYRDYGEYVHAVWCKSERKASASPKEGTPSPLTASCTRPVVKKGEPLPENVGDPKGSPSPWTWPIPLTSRVVATKAVLRNHFDPLFPDFGTEYPDQLRADEFLNEFDGFVRARKQSKGNELPAFVLLYLPNDHTNGTSPGKPRPAASVADNDLAMGRVVDAVSHSPYWDDTAIFILEDDAQDGADHVDAHRSIAFEISKYSPSTSEHPFVDSRFYTTVNMMHTMETLLGIPPMNQNDAYAPVMTPLFTGAGSQAPFSVDWSNRENGLIYQANPPRGEAAQDSAKMDFSRPDANNPAVLNRILWRDRKGNAPMPAPKHTVVPEHDADKD
ncbi:MAG: hypothetical protein NVS9B5_07370 [Terriglobales bacterium]